MKNRIQNVEYRIQNGEYGSHIKRVSCYILNSIFCILLSLTTQSQTLSLDSILQVIEKQNPMLHSYRSRATAMNSYVAGSASLMAPEVGGGLWMFPYQKQNYEHQQDTRQVMVSVSQTFTNPAKLKANKSYLSSRAAVEQSRERMAYNELRAQAKAAYYRWYGLEKKQQVLKNGEEILNLMMKIARLRYPYNQGKLNTIYKTEASLHELTNMQLMNENEIRQQRRLLASLMNVTQANFQIDTVSLKPASVLSAETDTTLLAAQRSDVQQIDRTIQSMRYNLAMEKTQLKPDFNINFSHMISVGAGMPNQFMLLGMVTIPIAPWSSKMYKANVQGMNHEIESMKQERAAMLNEARGMTTNMVTEIKTLEKQLENYEKRILPALKKNYDALMLAYEENREELPMVLDGWEAWNMTQLQYIDTQIRYYEMIVSYEKEIEQ
ncbi:MAG: TolC family protein [Cyclobacteriaceae bacterium]|nr:TolC family protein [Cyclobacteriaceae bacterium]